MCDIRDILEEVNPEAILWHSFDDALVGIGERCGLGPVAVYDLERMIGILVEEDESMSYDDAFEFISYNVLGAYVGEYTPIIMNTYKEG